MAIEENQLSNQPTGATPSNSSPNPSRLIRELLVFLRHRLSLDDDKADPQETIDYIRKGIEFQGTNVWILVFAIFIASVGLNMNSTAVIIGAMLISPLMGPIMGIGMGIGINDFDLIKRAAKNLGLMVGISVATSTLYFFLSPISDAQSELLARTQPTIWDVLIALFGGLAGIVAGSRREKSNAIPGVAIATALMPPLCTAGFGLATGNMSYFLGAFYLFMINSVFISLSTTVIVRYLRYPQKQFLDEVREKRAKRWIGAIVLAVVLPSLYIAFNLVQLNVFEREAGLFVKENFNFESSQVVYKNIIAEGDIRKIEVALVGDERISEERINDIRLKMKANSRLADAVLVVRQSGVKGMDQNEIDKSNKDFVRDLFAYNEEVIKTKDERIALLEGEISHLQSMFVPVATLKDEVVAINSNILEYSMTENAFVNIESQEIDTVLLAYAKFKSSPSSQEKEQLMNWVKARTKTDSVKLVVEVK